jgi:hypothetical protein
VRGQRIVVEGRLEYSDAYTYDVAQQTLFVLPAAHRGGTRTVRACVRFHPPVGGEVPNDLWSRLAQCR